MYYALMSISLSGTLTRDWSTSVSW